MANNTNFNPHPWNYWTEKNGQIRPCCINCQKFSWWDGDYCCLEHMKIHQHSPQCWMNEDILSTMESPDTCSEYIENPESGYSESFRKLLELEKLKWEYERQSMGESWIK